MPRYLFSEDYALGRDTAEWTPIPLSAYGASGYAHNAFPEIIAPQPLLTYTQQDYPLPYGTPVEPLSAL